MRYQVYLSLTAADGTVEYRPPPVYFYEPSLNVLASDTSLEAGVVVVEECVTATTEVVARRALLTMPDSVERELGGLAPILETMDGSYLAPMLDRATRLAQDLNREGLHDRIYMSTSGDGYLHIGRVERTLNCKDGALMSTTTDVRAFDPEAPSATADAAEHLGEMMNMIDHRNAAKDAERERQFPGTDTGRLARVEAQHRRVQASRDLDQILREAVARFGAQSAD